MHSAHHSPLVRLLPLSTSRCTFDKILFLRVVTARQLDIASAVPLLYERTLMHTETTHSYSLLYGFEIEISSVIILRNAVTRTRGMM